MTIDCTFYDPATGEITMVADLSQETLQHYANTDLTFLVQVVGDPATQYVVNGELVSYTVEEAAARATMGPGWVWKMPERVAVDTRELSETIAAHIRKIDAAANAARARILAEPTNNEEYRPTAEQAKEFKEAGYSGPVPPGVSTWTYAKRRKGWTDQQATDDILLTAGRWLNALWFIRGHRLDMKELTRDATTNYEADLVLETFLDGLTAAMQGVQ